MNVILDSGLEPPQGNGADTAGMNSDHGFSPSGTQSDPGSDPTQDSEDVTGNDSSPSASQSNQVQGNGDSAGIISPQDSSFVSLEGSTAVPDNGDTAGIIHPQDFSLESPQESTPVPDNGDTAGTISPQDSSLESPQESAPVPDNGDTAGTISPQDSSLESPQESTPVLGNGETAGTISPQDSSLESPQESAPVLGNGDTAGTISPQDSSLESPQESAPVPDNEDTAGTISPQDSSLESPQESTPVLGNGETAGTISPQDSSLESPQESAPVLGNGDTAGTISPQDSSLESPQESTPVLGNGETAGIISPQDSSLESPQESTPVLGNGENAGSIYPQDSSLQSPEESTPIPGDGDTAKMMSSHTSHLEAQGDGQTTEVTFSHAFSPEASQRDQGKDDKYADIISPQESSAEAPQERAPKQLEGETTGCISPESYSPTDTEQGASAADGNKETLLETVESQGDIESINQESSSVITAANGSDNNRSTLASSVNDRVVDSESLSGSTHPHQAEHHRPQVPTNVSNCVQETNTQTNNQTPDIATGAYSCPDQPSSVTGHEHISTATNEVSQILAIMSSTAVCPFSEQPLHDNDNVNSLRERHSESTNSKESHYKLLPTVTSNSQEDNHQATSNAESARPTSAAPEDTPLVSSRSPGQSHPAVTGIRNLFPQVSADSTSVGSERSSSEMDACDESNTQDNQTTEEAVEGDVVLVTGGSGFLGQHIVKLLHLRAPHVGEIRVLDLVYFEKKLDYPTTKPVKSLVGDISNAEFVHKAMKGVNSVIHVAGVVSWGTFPDYDGMEKVNVKGTLNVLNACLENNVQRLIYCSTVDVAVGKKPIRGGTEEDTPIPDEFLFPGYPETKFHGERIILGSAHLKRRDGEPLQTVILRPNVLYGELDKYYVTNALRMAKQSMGILYKIGNGKAMFQQAYVGNTAWAFVCADAAMKANPSLTREIFYVPDNTPVQNSFNFMLPYLQAHGLQLSTGYLSYALSHSAVAAAELLAKVVSPLVKLNLPVQSCTIAYINTDLYFRGEKAQRILNYYPIYTPSDARELSLKYYANLELEDRPRRGNNPEQR